MIIITIRRELQTDNRAPLAGLRPPNTRDSGEAKKGSKRQPTEQKGDSLTVLNDDTMVNVETTGQDDSSAGSAIQEHADTVPCKEPTAERNEKDVAKDAIEVTRDIARAVIEEAEDQNADIAADMRHVEAFVREEGGKLKKQLISEDDEVADGGLFDLLADALFGAVAAYTIPDVRKFVRENHDEFEDQDLVQKLLECPFTDAQLLEIASDNVDKIAKEGTPSAELYRKAIEAYVEHLIEKNCTGSKKIEPQGARQRRNSIYNTAGGLPPLTVVFDDEHSSKELVYGIEVDRTKRVINIDFRGSVTIRDWMADANLSMTMVPNPLKDERSGKTSMGKEIGFHTGFYDYLFGTKQRASGKSKFDTILEHLRSLLQQQQYEDYSIRAAGHSLGGALATLFSFFVSLEDDIPKPVKCISFASPRVGNTQFARAFQELETKGILFCVRVTNKNDVVTAVPDRLTCCSFWCQHKIYRHVGIELKLYGETKTEANQTHRLRFKRIHRSRFRNFTYDLTRLMQEGKTLVEIPCGLCKEDFLARHSCREYMHRLDCAGEELGDVSVDDLQARYGKIIHEPSGFFH